jgi:hypothetical protein
MEAERDDDTKIRSPRFGGAGESRPARTVAQCIEPLILEGKNEFAPIRSNLSRQRWMPVPFAAIRRCPLAYDALTGECWILASPQARDTGHPTFSAPQATFGRTHLGNCRPLLQLERSQVGLVLLCHKCRIFPFSPLPACGESGSEIASGEGDSQQRSDSRRIPSPAERSCTF